MNVLSMETKQINSLSDFSVFKLQGDGQLSSFLNSKQVVKFKKGDILIHEDEPFKGLYFICSGLSKVYQIRSNQQEFILGLGQQGSIIGIDSIISKSAYPHSVKALNDVDAYFLNADEVLNLFETNKQLRYEFIRELCSDINKIENRITSILNKKIKGQLAEILLISSDFDNNNSAVVKLSITDISKLIGTTQNYIYKIISDFVQHKLVKVENKKIKIINSNELSAIASGTE